MKNAKLRNCKQKQRLCLAALRAFTDNMKGSLLKTCNDFQRKKKNQNKILYYLDI